MKLIEIFDHMQHGELAQVTWGGGDRGITERDYPRVVSSINLGLTALHARFNLRERTVPIQMQKGLTVYRLDSRYAQSNWRSREPVKYLLDSEAEPFRDDVLKIEKVVLENNHELALNMETRYGHARTPDSKTLEVPAGLMTQLLKVTYRANHPILGEREYNSPESTEVDLPYSHLQALLYFVASRILNPVGISGEFHEGNNYAALYENECLRLEGRGLQVDISEKRDTFREKGWV